MHKYAIIYYSLVLQFLMEYVRVVYCHPYYFLFTWMIIFVVLSQSGIGCHIDDPCTNHAFYADNPCLMAPCPIVLHELINLRYDYSIVIDMNFNALKSYCIAFTPNLYKLTLPQLHINSLPISYTDSIKYLGKMFSINNSDDTELR